MKRVFDSGVQVPYDYIERMALTNLGEYHIVYRPSLVQHMDGRSIIQNKIPVLNRETIYFEDYLNELGIDYKDAYTLENRSKLNRL